MKRFKISYLIAIPCIERMSD